ncbi:MAG: hypothetical protein NTV73_05865 [Hyphomicrobiales bacterium]|nr:hypothetical protein [Hyphomicrobiales bacterium]
MSMSAIVHNEFDRYLNRRERRWNLQRIALRQHAADHPMTVFVVVATACLASMALVPPAGAAFATFEVAAMPGDASENHFVSPSVAAQAAKNVGMSEIDLTCGGQAWGAQTPGCLATIAKDSGRHAGRVVRVIAGA